MCNEPLKERFEDVVPVGEDEQRKEQPETDVVRHLKELIARFLARDNLPKQEQDVAAVKHGDGQSFLDIVFEATSALATAGLSSGILSSICIGSKFVLIVLMFIGRVGVITLGNVMLVRAHAEAAKRKSDLVV